LESCPQTSCSVLFSNETVSTPLTVDQCKPREIIEDCSYQCMCNCKRCSLCKQEMVNQCPDDQEEEQCFDNVLKEILTNKKCD
jgi:hypothetical protein